MRKVLAITFGLIAVVWLGALVLNRRSALPSPELAPTATVVTAPTPTPGIGLFKRDPARAASPLPEESATTPAGSDTPTEPFSDVLNAILTSSEEITNKAQQLLELLPKLPPTDREEAGRHFINLASDEQFLAAAPLLLNPETPPELVDLLMGESLNRPESVKLPVCLAVARQPGHPHAEEAHTVLFLYSDEDYGDNWEAWEKLVQAKLQELALTAPGPDTPN